MKLEEHLIPFLITNVFSLILIYICFKWPKIGKIAWSIIFLAAGIFNIITVWKTPQVYVESFGQTAVLPFYKSFISGVFSAHTRFFITLIGSGQILIAILLYMKRLLFNAGIAGGILFLLAISPLGLGSAFPATLLMAASLMGLYKRMAVTTVNS